MSELPCDAPTFEQARADLGRHRPRIGGRQIGLEDSLARIRNRGRLLSACYGQTPAVRAENRRADRAMTARAIPCPNRSNHSPAWKRPRSGEKSVSFYRCRTGLLIAVGRVSCPSRLPVHGGPRCLSTFPILAAKQALVDHHLQRGVEPGKRHPGAGSHRRCATVCCPGKRLRPCLVFMASRAAGAGKIRPGPAPAP